MDPMTEDEAFGSPKAMILSRSAIECGNIIRSLKNQKKVFPGSILKLFAKHLKVPEQQRQLDETQTNVVVGTPNRVEKLVELGNLNLDRCECIFIDMSLDAKNFCFFDIADVRLSFFNFYHKYVHGKMDKIKIALF